MKNHSSVNTLSCDVAVIFHLMLMLRIPGATWITVLLPSSAACHYSLWLFMVPEDSLASSQDHATGPYLNFELIAK
jgi:hypothetical protein